MPSLEGKRRVNPREEHLQHRGTELLRKHGYDSDGWPLDSGTSWGNLKILSNIGGRIKIGGREIGREGVDPQGRDFPNEVCSNIERAIEGD